MKKFEVLYNSKETWYEESLHQVVSKVIVSPNNSEEIDIDSVAGILTALLAKLPIEEQFEILQKESHKIMRLK